MMIRRWFLEAAVLLLVGGIALGSEVSEAQTGASGPIQKRVLRTAVDLNERPQKSTPAVAVGEAGHRVASARGESRDTDPANLKGERVPPVEAEPLAVDRGAAGLEQIMKRLGTRASLMMIVAHPDDEDGGMLAYVSRGLGARVGMLTLTRGEGGQNVMTGDFNEALGLVRTRELLAADRYMGVDQMFGTEVDFGFSKTKEEAFAQWTHERVLYDAVRAVRLYRPLVVASVFIGAPSDGHGQHQVSGEMAQEVFTAAAEPKIFPEMGLPVWAPAKVYARVPFARIDEKGMFDYATGKYVPARFHNYVTKAWSTDTPKADVTVPEGEASAALGGKSYVQFARQGLALQRTQIGAGVRLAPAGKFDVGYTRYGSRVAGNFHGAEKSFFDGVDTSLMGIADLAPSMTRDERDGLRGALGQIDASLKQTSAKFDAKQPEKIAPDLRDGLRALDGLLARVAEEPGVVERERYDVLHELRVKRVQMNQALTIALGLTLKAAVADDSESSRELLVPGEKYKLRMTLTNASGSPVEIKDCQLAESVGAESSAHSLTPVSCQGYRPAGGVTAPFQFTAGGSVPIDARGVRVPYTKKTSDQTFYDVSDPRMRDAALPLPALTAWMDLSYDGVPLRLGRVVGNEEHAAYQPVTVVPAVSVGVTPSAGVVPMAEESFSVTARVRGVVAGAKGTLRLNVPKGWKVAPERGEWAATGDGKDVAVSFTVTPERVGETPYTLTAVAESGGKEYHEGFHLVGYPGLVRDNLYAPATYRSRGADVKVPAGLKVAYLPGTGDAVAASLEDIAIHVDTVSVADIAGGRLKGFDALLMGVRTYAAQKDLPSVTGKLMEFANSGGVVVVQYQSPEYDGNDAPFPLSLGGAPEKVVEEDSRVRLLAPKAQVLSWPNPISEKDFDGWLEERGHGFMSEWDPRYAAVTEVHDAGQDPQKGGLLVAPVGEGAYVYCAYALYRQLPEGVPGAFRLMANMVSLGKRP